MPGRELSLTLKDGVELPITVKHMTTALVEDDIPSDHAILVQGDHEIKVPSIADFIEILHTMERLVQRDYRRQLAGTATLYGQSVVDALGQRSMDAALEDEAASRQSG